MIHDRLVDKFEQGRSGLLTFDYLWYALRVLRYAADGEDASAFLDHFDHFETQALENFLRFQRCRPLRTVT